MDIKGNAFLLSSWGTVPVMLRISCQFEKKDGEAKTSNFILPPLTLFSDSFFGSGNLYKEINFIT